jgi:hypothetical protein
MSSLSFCFASELLLSKRDKANLVSDVNWPIDAAPTMTVAQNS